MVIHTVVNEYDLLYAHQQETAYAEKKPSADEVCTDTAAYKNYTKLPDIRKGDFLNDNN